MNKVMNLLQPSLSRRLIVALLMAFALVAVVLIALDYWHIRAEFEDGPESALVSEIKQVGKTLDRFDRQADVQAILLAMQWHANALRHQQGLDGDLMVALHDQSGHVIWTAPGAPALQALAPEKGQRIQTIQGRRYRVAQRLTRHGHLIMAEPYPGDGCVLTLLLDGLLPSMLIAFPLVLLPIWLAVAQGLKPLRQLSADLGRRKGQDLSPVGLDLKYTELQPLVAAFNGLLDKLRHQMQRERAFVQDAAHELRTPMAVIAAQAHLLAGAVDEVQRCQARDALEGAIERASHLAQQLLALASLDDVQASAIKQVNLPHLLQQLLAQAMPFAHKRGMDIELDAPDAWPTQLDVVALQSVLGNLVDNAIKYGRDGGRIVVTLIAQAGELVLTVSDDGPGIPPERREQVFDRFVRGGQDDIKGTGLGLAIAQQGTRRLRGGVRLVAGLDGKGVGFEVRWPAQGSM